MTLFDVIAGLLLVISGFNGLMKGGARIVGGIVAFVGAALLAILFLRISAPIARNAISPDWAAVTAALLVVFAVLFVIFGLVSGHIAKTVQGTGGVGALDRGIGAAFGIIRALVILGAFTLLIQMAAAPKPPASWIREATLYPLTSAAGKVLKALAPGAFATAGKIAPKVGEAVKDGAGYEDDSRKAMDDLVEKTR